MQEQSELQAVPVKMYSTEDRLMIAAPMPGLQPEDISVEITGSGRIVLDGRLRGTLKGVKDLLLSEWSVGGYHREIDLPMGVDGEMSNVTYDNGVLVVAMPISERQSSATLQLQSTGRARGQSANSTGSNLQPTSTNERLAEQAAQRERGAR
jgi:HSP20 family protein